MLSGNWSKESGASLVQLMVALAISGVIMVMVATMFGRGLQAFSESTMRSSQMQVRDLILNYVDCEASFTATTCSSPDVELYKHGGGILIPGQGKRFGELVVRAKCNKFKDGLIIESARMKKGESISSTLSQSFLQDIRGEVRDWKHPRSAVFPEGVVFCPNGRS